MPLQEADFPMIQESKSIKRVIPFSPRIPEFSIGGDENTTIDAYLEGETLFIRAYRNGTLIAKIPASGCAIE